MGALRYLVAQKSGAPCAANINAFHVDGNEDVLVEFTDSTYGAVVAVYKTPGEAPFSAANNPWPMAGHDPQRTGWFSCKQQRQACTTNAECCSANCTGSCR